MNRRVFLKIAGAAVAVVATGLELALPERVKSFVFDPMKYRGDWQWIRTGDGSGFFEARGPFTEEQLMTYVRRSQITFGPTVFGSRVIERDGTISSQSW